MQKILIRAPYLAEEIISSYSLIHRVFDEYQDAQVNIIVNEGMTGYYEFLPFKLHIFEFPEEKDNLAGIHHFSVNLADVFNIDLYIDLVNDMKSSFMGLSFSAKKKIGYKRGVKNFFYSHRIDDEEIENNEEKYMKLFSSFLEKDFKNYVIRTNKEESVESNIEPLFKEPEKVEYFLILINVESFEEQFEIWQKLLSKFKNIKLIIWQRGEEKPWQDFVSGLDEECKPKLQILASQKQLNGLIGEAKAIFSNIPWLSYLSCYLGKNVFHLNSLNESQEKFKYWDNDYYSITYSGTSPQTISTKNENHQVKGEEEVADFIHNLLSL